MKLLNYLSYVTLSIAFVFLAVLAYWYFYPYKTIDVKTPITVDKSVYNAGDTLTYTVNYCKYINLPATVHRNYVDGVIYNLSTIVTNNPPGCHITHPITTVPNLPSGKYFIRILFSYEVNPIRTITITVETEPFEVVFNDSTASGHLQDER